MIQSMTGYGKSEVTFNEKKIHVEIKSLNSKTLDLSTRIAPLYREKEMEIRQMIAQRLIRGKVDFSIWIERDTVADATPINAALIDSYHRQISQIARSMGVPEPADWMTTLLRLPDVLSKTEVEELADDEWQAAKGGVEQALQHLVDFRTQEGEALAGKFAEKLDNIRQLLASLETLKSIPEIDYDKNRLEQELIYYIEKLDINEEKQRLANHLDYFRHTMNDGIGQGKKLGFIAQEMGREINTTGSKSNHAEMQNIVVRMKDELEQIKEQVLNVL